MTPVPLVPLPGPPTDGVVRAHRALSYAFTVRTTDELVGAAVAHVLGDFAVPDRRWAERAWPPESDVDRWAVAEVDGAVRVFRGDRQLYAGSSPGDALDHFLWALNQRVLRVTRDFFVLHAGAVVSPRGAAVLLPADAGSGKSSLTLALVRRGWTFLSDEFAPIDPVSGLVHPFPKAATLKAGSWPLFADELAAAPVLAGARQRHLRAEDVGGSDGRVPAVVRAVVFPRYVPAATATAGRLGRTETASRLLANAPSLPVYGGRALPVIGRLARCAAGFALEHSDLDEAVAVVDRCLTEGIT